MVNVLCSEIAVPTAKKSSAPKAAANADFLYVPQKDSQISPEVILLLSEFSRPVVAQPREMTLMIRNIPNR